jgi:hypothetical protein
MPHQRLPGRRPAEVAHQRLRQAERKVEAAQPRPRALEQRLELTEALQPFQLVDDQGLALEAANRGRNGLRAPRRAGEVDAEDPHCAISS